MEVLCTHNMAIGSTKSIYNIKRVCNAHSSSTDISFCIWHHSCGCSRVWIIITSKYLNYYTTAAKDVHCLSVVHLLCGFMAYHYTTVVLVQGVATTCWHQIRYYCVCCTLYLIYSWLITVECSFVALARSVYLPTPDSIHIIEPKKFTGQKFH